MSALPEPARARSLELFNQLRDVLPDVPAEYIGRLDPDEPMAVVEAYLYVRRQRLPVPDDLYRAMRFHVLHVLDAQEGSARALLL